MDTKQNGSSTFALVAAMTVIGVTNYYVEHSTQRTKANIDELKRDDSRSQSSDNAMSAGSTLKANLSTVKSNNYQPALLASNYYDANWNLIQNSSVTMKNTTLPGGTGNVVRIAIPSSYGVVMGENVAKIMMGDSSTLDTGLHDSKITVLKTNFDKTDGILAESLDVQVDTDVVESGKKESRTYQMRIPLAHPKPYAPVLQLRALFKPDSWQDITKISQLETGNYAFRVLASGIVYNAKVYMNGAEIGTVGGFTMNNGVPKISHSANNFLAKDEVIGEFSHLIELKSQNSQGNGGSCTYVPIDGQFTFSLKVFGPAQTDETTSEISAQLKVNEYNETISDAQRDSIYLNKCNNDCPYRGAIDGEDNDLVDAAEFNQMSQSGTYSDYTMYHLMVDQAPKFGVLGNKKLCQNFQKAAAAFKETNNKWPSGSDLVDFGKSYSQFTEYFVYNSDTCDRTPVFTRGSCGCFAEKTLITLGDGKTQKAINQITYGDSVWNPVLKKAFAIRKITKGPEKLPMISVLADSKEVVVTGKHPFPTRSGFKTAFKLEVGDEIRIENDRWVKVQELKTLKAGSKLPDVYNIELNASNEDMAAHNILANGVVTGDLYIQTILDQTKTVSVSIKE